MCKKRFLILINVGISMLFVQTAVYSQTLGERITNAEKIIILKTEAPLIFAGDGKEAPSTLLLPEFESSEIRVGQNVTFSYGDNSFKKTYLGKVAPEYIDFMNERIGEFLSEKCIKGEIVLMDPNTGFDEKTTDADFYVVTEWVPMIFIDIMAVDTYNGMVRTERVNLNYHISFYEKREGKKGKKIASSSKVKGEKYIKVNYSAKDNIYEDEAQDQVVNTFYDTFKSDVEAKLDGLCAGVEKKWNKK